VLVAIGPEIALQAAAVRPAVSIVMLANNYDPFARGYVSSIARPGGNWSLLVVGFTLAWLLVHFGRALAATTRNDSFR